jgi:hypothetical protein
MDASLASKVMAELKHDNTMLSIRDKNGNNQAKILANNMALESMTLNESYRERLSNLIGNETEYNAVYLEYLMERQRMVQEQEASYDVFTTGFDLAKAQENFAVILNLASQFNSEFSSLLSGAANLKALRLEKEISDFEKTERRKLQLQDMTAKERLKR